MVVAILWRVLRGSTLEDTEMGMGSVVVGWVYLWVYRKFATALLRNTQHVLKQLATHDNFLASQYCRVVAKCRERPALQTETVDFHR